jgi:hypothetical protein
MANDLAWQEGWEIGSQSAQERRAHKEALSDEEHEQKVTELVDNLKANQAKLSALKDENGNPLPGYDDALNNLQNNVRDLRELYHPEKYPGAIQRVGHLLTDALHITNPQDRIKKDAASKEAQSAKDEKEALGMAGAAPPSPAQAAVTTANANAAGELTSIQAKMANIKKLFPDLTPEQQTSFQNELAASITGVKPTPDKFYATLADTVDDQGKHHYWRVPMVEGEQPEEVDFGGQVLQPKTAAHPSHSKFAETEAAYRHDYNIAPDEPLTVADIMFINQQTALSSAAPSETVSTSLKQDMNGWYVPVTETNRRIPGLGEILKPPRGAIAGGAGAQPGSTPTNLNGVKKKAHAAGSPSASSGPTHVGKPVLRGRTPEYTAAYKDFKDADGLSKLADLVVQHPDEAINQKRLAVALEKVSAGRFTTQALDYIIKAGWGNTIEQWANNPSTGALPTDVLRQLVDGAHENMESKKQVLDDITSSEDESGGAGTTSPSTNPDLEAIIKGLKGATAQPAPAH